MSQNRRNLYIHTQVVWLSLFCAVGFNAYAVDDAVLQKFYAEIKSATEEYDKTVAGLRSNQVEPGVGTYKTTGKRRTKGYDEEEETPVGAMFEINGFCFVDGKDFDLKEKETCDKLTRRGTWWISSSFGNIEGDARCGQPSEQEDLVLADMGQIPCFCKITSIDGKSIADAKWVHTASYDPKGKFDSQSDFFCESNCAGYCHDSLFKHKRLGNAYGYLREYLAELKSGNIQAESTGRSNVMVDNEQTSGSGAASKTLTQTYDGCVDDPTKIEDKCFVRLDGRGCQYYAFRVGNGFYGSIVEEDVVKENGFVITEILKHCTCEKGVKLSCAIKCMVDNDYEDKYYNPGEEYTTPSGKKFKCDKYGHWQDEKGVLHNRSDLIEKDDKK